MKRTRGALLAALALLGAACQDGDLTTIAAPEGARLAISDGAHGGLAGFYFLPPLVENPHAKGTFDGTLSPAVTVCEWTGAACGATVAQFTNVGANGSHYHVNWNTKGSNLQAGAAYRITVTLGTRVLGWLDAQAVTGGGAKGVPAETFPLQIGRTVPIKFRIEAGLPPEEPEDPPCVSHAWTEMPTPTDQGNWGIWGASTSDVWAANWVGVLHYDGTQWSSVDEVMWHGTLDVHGFGTSDVWFAGQEGRILHWDGSGWTNFRFDGTSVFTQPLNTWEALPENIYLYGIWGAAPNDLWAVGDQGVILHYDGAAWSVVRRDNVTGLRRVWGSSATDVYATGSGGTLLHWDGAAWSPVAVPTTQDLWGVWGSGANDVWVVGAAGTILHYDGTSWTLDPAPTTWNLNGVYGVDGEVFLAGQAGTILRRVGSRWCAEESGVGSVQIFEFWGPSIDDLFASAHGGKITHR